MNTSEVLNKAADLIEQRGWEQGEGWPTSSRAEDAPLCLEGGIAAAMGMRFRPNFSAGEHDLLAACPAYIAVANYLDDVLAKEDDTDPISLWWWNDHYAKTAGRIIATLRAAAVIEAAKENAEARVEVSA